MTENFTHEDMFDELFKYNQPVPARTGGMTRQEYGARYKIEPKTAGNHLNKLVEDGVMYRVKQRCEDGLVRFVYYFVED